MQAKQVRRKQAHAVSPHFSSSALLKRLKGEKRWKARKTSTFNYEKLSFGLFTFHLWDLAGSLNRRLLWRHYFLESSFLLWIVDACDVSRLEESRTELHKILSTEKELATIPLLVLANKVDEKEKAQDIKAITEALKLKKIRDRTVGIIEISAKKGRGIRKATNWVEKILLENGGKESKKCEKPIKNIMS